MAVATETIEIPTAEEVSEYTGGYAPVAVPDEVPEARLVRPMSWAHVLQAEGVRRRAEVGTQGRDLQFKFPEPFCGKRSGALCPDCTGKGVQPNQLYKACGKRHEFYFIDKNRPTVHWNYLVIRDPFDQEALDAGEPILSWDFQVHVAFAIQEEDYKTMEKQEWQETDGINKGRRMTGGKMFLLPKVDPQYHQEMCRRAAFDFINRRVPQMCAQWEPPVSFNSTTITRPHRRSDDRSHGHEVYVCIMQG